MLEALERHFPAQAEWTRPEGGLFVWATLPDYIDTTDLLAKALRENVAFVPGRAAYADGRGGHSMRLNFSGSTEDEIREGIRRIGGVVAEQVELYETITGEHQVARSSRDARGKPRTMGGDVVPMPPRRRRREGRGAQGRAVARARGLAALRRPGRGRARCARPRGRPDRRRRRAGLAPARRARPTSPSSPSTGPAARTARSRSCSRSSAIPYTGPGVAACALCMDKVAAKHEMRAAGIPTPDWVAFNATAFGELGAADTLRGDRAAARLPARRQAGQPGLVARGRVRRRPRDEVPGRSGRGVQLRRPGAARALRRGPRAGGRRPRRRGRCRSSRRSPRDGDVFNFEARYEIGRTDYACPAELAGDEAEAVARRRRCATYEALGCAGFARVDLMLGDDGPAGARGQRDPRPDRHEPAPDGRRGGRDRASRAGRADPRAGERPRARHPAA